MKRLVIIDYNVTASSPSMKGMLRVLPELLAAGWEVTVWSHQFTSPDARIGWRRFPGIPGPGLAKFLGFSAMVHWAYWRENRRARGKGELVLWQSTGTYLMAADVVFIQFVSSFYLREMKQRGAAVPLKERVLHGVALTMEKWQRAHRRPWRQWLVVSRRLASDLQALARPEEAFRLLPNSYDARRWNPEVREASRAAARRRLGVSEHEIVLAFVGLGSFGRKGLPLALAACHRLVKLGLPVRLLVLGGASEKPPDLAAYGEAGNGADLSFAIAHGRTPDIPQLLSACEGLLFPSFFEAFSLVEIEAAALGLRLYLTPHYGAEMLLEDGRNGRLLPWDAEGIAGVLAEEVRSGALRAGASFGAEALIGDEAYGQVYASHLEEAWSRKVAAAAGRAPTN